MIFGPLTSRSIDRVSKSTIVVAGAPCSTAQVHTNPASTAVPLKAAVRTGIESWRVLLRSISSVGNRRSSCSSQRPAANRISDARELWGVIDVG